MRVRQAVLVLMVALCGCSASHHGSAPTTSTVPHVAALTTRLEVRSRVVPQGGTLAGWLVVDNESGHPIGTPRCTAWEVAIANDSFPARAIEAIKCGDGPVLAVGEHRYPFTATAQYSCGPGSPPSKYRCGYDPEPLPIGDYRAELVQLGGALPMPAPVPVRVVAVASRRGFDPSMCTRRNADGTVSGVEVDPVPGARADACALLPGGSHPATVTP